MLLTFVVFYLEHSIFIKKKIILYTVLYIYYIQLAIECDNIINFIEITYICNFGAWKILHDCEKISLASYTSNKAIPLYFDKHPTKITTHKSLLYSISTKEYKIANKNATPLTVFIRSQ